MFDNDRNVEMSEGPHVKKIVFNFLRNFVMRIFQLCLMKVTEFIFCLLEHQLLFSIMNSVRSLDYSCILESTVQVLLFYKVNT